MKRVWRAGGWLARLGALDFAGGTVVHISAGVSALVAAPVPGSPAGLPALAPRAPPRALGPGGRRPALVRLVRLQCRVRAHGQRNRRSGVREHQCRRRGGAGRLGGLRSRADRQDDRGGSGHRRGGGAGRHHAGGGLRHRTRSARHRRALRWSELYRDADPALGAGWTIRSTSSPAMASPASEARSSRGCSRRRRPIRRVRMAFWRARWPGGDAAGRHPVRGAGRHRHRVDPEGDRPDEACADGAPRRNLRARPQRARRRSLCGRRRLGGVGGRESRSARGSFCRIDPAERARTRAGFSAA